MATATVVPGRGVTFCWSWSIRTSPAGSIEAVMAWRIPRASTTSGWRMPSANGMPMMVLRALPCSPRVGER
jgi:hypothetical protein